MSLNYRSRTLEQEETKKDGPCYADVPEAHANLWKGAPQARNRIYPSVIKLTE